MARPSARARSSSTARSSIAALLGVSALAAACFGPDYPTGIPCSEAQTCPPGQVCAGFVPDGQGCAPVLMGPGSPDAPRQWGDGTAAASCQQYRFPPAPYRYEGATGDGFYRIVPPGRAAPVTVFCDMTTDGGGWTAIDPAAAAALVGVATAVRADGTIQTCRVQNGLLEAFYRRGTESRLLVCQYDIDLGIAFDAIRVSAAEDQMRVRPGRNELPRRRARCCASSSARADPRKRAMAGSAAASTCVTRPRCPRLRQRRSHLGCDHRVFFATTPARDWQSRHGHVAANM